VHVRSHGAPLPRHGYTTLVYGRPRRIALSSPCPTARLPDCRESQRHVLPPYLPYVQLRRSTEWQRGCFSRRGRVLPRSPGWGRQWSKIKNRTGHRLYKPATRRWWPFRDPSCGGLPCSTISLVVGGRCGRAGRRLFDLRGAGVFLCQQTAATRALTADGALVGTGGAV
jgi:hypothetical protein